MWRHTVVENAAIERKAYGQRQGCGTGWIFTGSDLREKNGSASDLQEEKKTRILIRIPPSRKTSRIQILPNVVRIKFKLLCSFAIKVDIIDILIQYSIFDQCILQELVDFRARFLILMFRPDPTLF